MLTYNLDDFSNIASNLNKHVLSEEVLLVYDKLLKELNINTHVIEHDLKEKKYKRDY
jgi:hypothetical protein